MVWIAFKRVVVETWVDCWAAELTFRAAPCAEEVVEYIDIRLLDAIVAGPRGSLPPACKPLLMEFEVHQKQESEVVYFLKTRWVVYVESRSKILLGRRWHLS